MASILFWLVLSLVLSPPISSLTTLDSLSIGSSLSVETTDLLVSPNGIFSAGFFPVGNNAYCFAIWFSKPSCGNNCTVVWMANRDQPINGRRSKLSLLQDGNLILTDAGQFHVWATNTVSDSSVQLRLSDSGNLVLRNSDGVKLWQSFDSPTDTLLPEQPLTRDTKLVSSRSQSNYSSGFYKFFFDNDNVIRLLYDGPAVSSIYWPDPGLVSWNAGRTTYNSSRIAVLDSLGKFTSTDRLSFLCADYGAKIQRRLTIDFDGNLRVYSREEETGTWNVSWLAIKQPCMVHGLCGPNALCSYTPTTSTSSGRKCSCIPGYKMRNDTDWFFGCEPEFNVSCGNTEVGFLKLSGVVFYGNDIAYFTNYTFEMCENYCLQLCNCKGFEYKFFKSLENRNGVFCYIKTQLLNGYHMPSVEGGDQYVKLPKTTIFSYSKSPKEFRLNCSNEVPIQLDRAYARRHENESLYFALWFACAIGGIEILGTFLVWIFLIRTHQKSSAATQVYLQAATGFKRFTYAELKKATKGFSEQIGRGSGGTVYKGVLSDQRVAAIKQLDEAKQGEAEFLAEVSTIGRLNHMNLIEMWGYCAEGKHRLLVYEYMEHGSLAENLSSSALDWEKRFKIAVGTAKGLAYLHEECLEWVLHCDVKPQNILLDSTYQPKVSDFGLSRLLSRVDQNNSSFSRIRGTRGYMAPEWVYKLPITSKVDVYSYGIVVLEMVTGKNPSIGVHAMDDAGAIEYRSLVPWVREKMNAATTMASWVKEIIDPVLGDNYDLGKMEILVAVALQCVEEMKDARPTMSQVVESLLRHENDE